MFPVEKCFALATLTLSLLAACGGATSKANGDEAGNSVAAGTTAGSPADSGVQSPSLPIEGDPIVTVLDSTLGTYADGQPRWAFTFRNNANTPLCRRALNATLLDAEGSLLAGAPLTSQEYGRGVPAFAGLVMGSVYRGFRDSGVDALDVCVPPGGRGLAVADIWSQNGLFPEEVSQILDAAATLGHDLTLSGSGLLDLEPAPELPRLKELQLVDTPDGKVVQGVSISGAELAAWRAWVALFDGSGLIVDVVPVPVDAISAAQKDTPAPFLSAPVAASATRLEAFFESSTLRH